jgi:uncharacterized lipoprotein YmbA
MTLRRPLLLLPAALLALAACAQNPPTLLCGLAPMARDGAPAAEPETTGRRRPGWIAVGPVTIADYLDRPQIVTRTSSTELQLAEFHKWVEDLETAFPRVLVEDLTVLLGTQKVTQVPVPREIRIDQQVEVDVLQLDASDPSMVTLDAMWRIYGADGERLLDEGRTRIQKPVDAAPPPSSASPTDGKAFYDSVVQAMSDATADLGRAIAEALGRVRAKSA